MGLVPAPAGCVTLGTFPNLCGPMAVGGSSLDVPGQGSCGALSRLTWGCAWHAAALNDDLGTEGAPGTDRALGGGWEVAGCTGQSEDGGGKYGDEVGGTCLSLKPLVM